VGGFRSRFVITNKAFKMVTMSHFEYLFQG
jgi:hypothetical protein